MDRAARNFLSLVGISATLAAYAVCGLVAYVLVPFLDLRLDGLVRIGPACFLPAVALVTTIGVSIGLFSRALVRHGSASRRLSRRVRIRALPAPPELLAVARAAGLKGKVTVVDSPTPFSFAYGVIAPCVAISRGFLDGLEVDELRAALEHERYHVLHLDPLRALLGKALVEAFFLLPSLEVLRLRYEASRELAADRRAERACGRRPLLRALLKAVEGSSPEAVVSASLADPGVLEARISRLETGQEPALAPVGMSSVLASTLGASSFLLLFAAAVLGVGGTTALADAVAHELSIGGALFAALCLGPIAAGGGLAYWWLARRAR